MRIPFFCSYIPAGLLEALGHELVDITLFREETCGLEYSCALHDNLCSYAKYLYKKILGDGFDFAVVPNSCDAMKKLYGALRLEGGMAAFLLDLPRRSGPEGARYLAAQYEAMLTTLDPGFDRNGLLRRLAGGAAAHRSLPVEGSGEEDGLPLRIGIVGSSFVPSFFKAILSRHDAAMVILRHCGYGIVPGPAQAAASTPEGALFDLAQNSLERTICPRADRGGLADFIMEEVRDRNLSGLIFTTLKFCDFYAFEFERVRRRLPPDFPLLYLEGDLSIGNDEQNRTRIEAFMEKIRSGMKEESLPHPCAPVARRAGTVLGIDVGSAATKGILLEGGSRILARVCMPTSIDMKQGAEETIGALLGEAGMARGDVARIVLTGYGRTAFPEREQITEITCHALGVAFLRPAGATVIDVGGQDSKAIRIDARGRVLRFAMNDKCAAGTGRFLESMVKRMNISFDQFSALALAAAESTPISSMCSVFAESEVVSLMARGVPAAHIARGLNAAVAGRVRGLVDKIQGAAPFVLTGGMAQNQGFVRELEAALGASVAVFADSQLAGAIGAALVASSDSQEVPARLGR